MSDPIVSPRRLYLDNSATSFPKPRAVLDAMHAYAIDLGASAGRGAYREAVDTGILIHECRQRLCRLLNAERPEHVIFTLNCTEALNLAIKGLIEAPRTARPAHAICTAIDHNSILRPLTALQDRGWVNCTRVAIDPKSGLVDPQDVRRAIRPDTKLIAITHVSNVTGTIQPIRAIGEIARECEVPFIVDAAQSAGHVPIDLTVEPIDLLAAPGHKGLLGPLGTGLLYVRPGMERRLRSLVEGGTGSASEQPRQPDSMPDRYESGSHNAIGIAGLSAAVQWLLDETVAKVWAHEQDLIRTFIDGAADVEGLKYYGPFGIRDRAGVFSVRVDGFDPHELATVLENQYGILTRAGLHCAPLAHAALGTLESGGTTRLSFGPFLSKQDVKFVTDALAEIAMNVAAR
jgi:cysteine desulfurase family protein